MLSTPGRLFKGVLCAVLIVQLAGCGTIMYPERRGQRGGKIDAGVAVLDGVGLLLFILPGLIAFAVDFSTGAIYLPGTSRSSADQKNIKVISFDPRHTTREGIEEIIKKETGYDVKLNQATISRLKSTGEVLRNLATAIQEIETERIQASGAAPRQNGAHAS